MSDNNNKQVNLAIPGEWMIKKIFGPTFDEVGLDLKSLYKIGRDKIILATARKTNIEDGTRVNLRVARDVFWNGAYTDESICAEYFGGILASSRSVDGADDLGIFYADIIKSLSSKQLLLHYIIYSAFNKLWLDMPSDQNRPNVGLMDDLQKYNIWFASLELDSTGHNIEKDVIAVASKALIGSTYAYNQHKIDEEKLLPYLQVQPSTLGVQLYAVAHNKLKDWRMLPFQDFGLFPDIEIPTHFALTVEGLIKAIDGK